MSIRLPRLLMLVVAFAAMSTGAFGQATATKTASGPDALDLLPKHPIPYRKLKEIGVKPKPKAPSAAPSAQSPANLKPAKAGGAAAPVSGVKPAAGPAAAASPAHAAAPPKSAQNLTAPPTASKPITPPVPLAVKPAPKPTTAAPPKSPPVQLAPPPPLSAPQPGARLQPGQALPASELEAFIDGQVSRAMSSDHIAGVAVAVVQNGQLVMEKGYSQTPHTPLERIDPRSTLVRLGSASQIFTWIAALKSVEDGKLKLDAPVNSYLPDDLQLPDEGFNRPILFRHLMTHTAGLEDRALGRRFTWDAEKLVPLDEALQKFRPRRVRAPGLMSIPSDYGVALAGEIVAKAEGRPFDQLIETEILKPLALSHTSFREPYPASSALPETLSQSLSSSLGPGFRWSPQGFAPQPFAYGQSLAPALSAVTTADDMARLMIALLNNGRIGEASLYSARTATLLRTPLQRAAPGMDGWAHGLAMQRLSGGFEALDDIGAAPEFHSNMTLIPGLNVGVFIVANTDTGGALVRDLPGAVAQRFYASPSDKPASIAASEVDYAGDYLSAKRAYHGLEAFADRLTKQSTLMAGADGGLVMADARGASAFAPTGNADIFRSGNGAELFVPNVGGKVRAYVLGSGGGAAERIGGIHSRGVLQFWASATALTVLASFAGLFIRDRIDPRETRAQVVANITQVVTCVAWCLAFGAFALFVKGGLSPIGLMFDWPNRWLITASWAALLAGVLSLAMVTQLPGAWREERRIHGWSAWRKVRHTATVLVFLVFTAILASWGALEPWSS